MAPKFQGVQFNGIPGCNLTVYLGTSSGLERGVVYKINEYSIGQTPRAAIIGRLGDNMSEWNGSKKRQHGLL